MNKLEEILNDFYCCLNLPIHFINKDFEIIYKKGYCNDSFDLLFNTNVYNDIKEDTLSVLKLTYYKNIHFIIMPTLKECSYNGYFIVGPFKSKNIYDDINIPFKPFYCIDYISYILKNIINEKLLATNSLSSYVENAIDYIHKNYYKDIKIDTVCNSLNLNKSYFCCLFKKETGYTFTNFLNKLRIEKSKKLLINKDLSILDVALNVGFNNHNYYSTTFKKFNNQTPLEYKNILLNQ